jgi:hypothetical protein
MEEHRIFMQGKNSRPSNPFHAFNHVLIRFERILLCILVTKYYIFFFLAVAQYGKNWTKVQHLIPSRTSAQIRSHAQKVLNPDAALPKADSSGGSFPTT